MLSAMDELSTFRNRLRTIWLNTVVTKAIGRGAPTTDLRQISAFQYQAPNQTSIGRFTDESLREAVQALDRDLIITLLTGHAWKVLNQEFFWVSDYMKLHSIDKAADKLIEDRQNASWTVGHGVEIPHEVPLLDHENAHCRPACPHGDLAQKECRLPRPAPGTDHTRSVRLFTALNTIDQLCGIGGVFPPSADVSTRIGSVQYNAQHGNAQAILGNSTCEVSDLGILDQISDRLLRAAAIAQQHHACCDSYTIIVEQSPSCEVTHSPAVQILPVRFAQIQELSRRLRSYRRATKDRGDLLVKLKESIHEFLSSLDLRIDIGTDEVDVLRAGALLLQTLSWAFVTYLRVHTGPVQPLCFTRPLASVALNGLHDGGADGKRYTITAEPRRLAGLKGGTGRDTYLVFSLRHQTLAQNQVAIDTEYRVRCRFAELGDAFGCAGVIYYERRPEHVIAFTLGDGMLFTRDGSTFQWESDERVHRYSKTRRVYFDQILDIGNDT